MNNHGQHTYSEITTQPDAWAEALRVSDDASQALQSLWRASDTSELLFTGCGSTYYLSLTAASLANYAGLRATALPASELWLTPQCYASRIGGSLLVAVSRSGETSETLRAVDAFHHAGGRGVVAVTCYPNSALADRGDLLLAVPAAQEQSLAQTRSFASMLLLCQALVARLVSRTDLLDQLERLPAAGRVLMSTHGDMAARLGCDLSFERFLFLGHGPRYGLACEAMLKMKEMSLTYSEAYHVLEFRHGPKAMIDAQSLVVGLLSQSSSDQERAVLAEMNELGAYTLTLAAGEEDSRSGSSQHRIAVGAGQSELASLVLYLPFLQLLAYQRAIAKGLDPDRPRNLTPVVTL